MNINVPIIVFSLRFVLGAEVREFLKSQGDEEYRKKDFSKAIHYYAEALKLESGKDKELKAKIYSNRATAHFALGEKYCIFLVLT